MSYNPEFARQINEALMRLDRPPAWLAQRLGVNQSTVSRWLNQGARPRDPETVVRVADVLGMSSERERLLGAAGFAYQETIPDAQPAVEAAPHARNLPTQTTPLVGRSIELAHISERLADPNCRLLTLTGPGGIGKTRLAVAVAEQSELPVVYVPLQPVTSAHLVPSAVADAADIRLAGPEPLAEQLVDRLRARRLLLVLDNFEHLLESTELLLDILDKAPEIKLLVTSREALYVREEYLYPVAGLPYPQVEEVAGASADEAATYSSVQLFVARARQIRHDFRLEDDVDSVAAICQAVDGMPLAIELAASWLRVWDRTAIAHELRHSLDILSTRLRNVPERHQSIRAVCDASWKMLRESERDVYAKLSVFRGGFTYASAVDVAGATAPVLDSLVAKSLLYREPGGRYQIHELLRQYGAEKLAESPFAQEAATAAHSAYFMRFLADLAYHFHNSRQFSAADDIGMELDNVREAWLHAVEHENTDWLYMASSTLLYFCQFRSLYVEGVELFSQAWQRLKAEELTAQSAATLVNLLTNYGWLCIRVGKLAEAEQAVEHAFRQYETFDIAPGKRLEGYPGMAAQFIALTKGEYDRAIAQGKEVLRVAAEHAAPAAAANPHFGMASAYYAQSDYVQAKAHAEQALALSMSEGNLRNSIFARAVLGKVELAEGNLRAAKRHFGAAHTISEQMVDMGSQAEHLANLADVAIAEGEWQEARELLPKSLTKYEEIGDRGGVARTKLGLGTVALETGDVARARSYFGSALAVAWDARIAPMVLSVAAVAGGLLLHDAETQELGLRTLCFVCAHPSCDVRTRIQVEDTLHRNGLEPCNGSETIADLETLVAALQAQLSTTTAPHMPPPME